MAQNALSTAAALTVAYSAKSTVQLNREAIMLRAMDRSYETELQTNLDVKIPNPNYNVRSRTRTGPTQNWQDGNEGMIEYLDHLLVNTPVEVSSIVDYRAARRTPIDYLNRLRSQQIADANVSLENLVVTALDSATIVETKIGSNTNRVGADGMAVGDGRTLPRRLIDAYIVRMARANAIGTAALSPIGGQLVECGALCLRRSSRSLATTF